MSKWEVGVLQVYVEQSNQDGKSVSKKISLLFNQFAALTAKTERHQQ